MIDARCRHPGGGSMTGRTLFCRGSMGINFSCRQYAIMAVPAGPQYLGVIHIDGWPPDIDTVAGITHIRRRDMIAPSSSSQTAVMASSATAQHFFVIHMDNRNPGNGAVTGGALASSGNMGRKLAAGGDAVVTTQTIITGSGMIHQCGNGEAFRAVANITLFIGGDVGNRLTEGDDVIMATGTITRYTFKYAIDMTGFTIDELMLSGQGKSGREVIKLGIGCGGNFRASGHEHAHPQKDDCDVTPYPVQHSVYRGSENRTRHNTICIAYTLLSNHPYIIRYPFNRVPKQLVLFGGYLKYPIPLIGILYITRRYIKSPNKQIQI